MAKPTSKIEEALVFTVPRGAMIEERSLESVVGGVKLMKYAFIATTVHLIDRSCYFQVRSSTDLTRGSRLTSLGIVSPMAEV